MFGAESLQAAEHITVQCLDAYPMELSLVNMSPSHHANELYHLFIHLDRHLSVGRFSVFTSSKSHVVVKFATVSKKYKAELQVMRQLSNENMLMRNLIVLLDE